MKNGVIRIFNHRSLAPTHHKSRLRHRTELSYPFACCCGGIWGNLISGGCNVFSQTLSLSSMDPSFRLGCPRTSSNGRVSRAAHSNSDVLTSGSWPDGPGCVFSQQQINGFPADFA